MQWQEARTQAVRSHLATTLMVPWVSHPSQLARNHVQRRDHGAAEPQGEGRRRRRDPRALCGTTSATRRESCSLAGKREHCKGQPQQRADAARRRGDGSVRWNSGVRLRPEICRQERLRSYFCHIHNLDVPRHLRSPQDQGNVRATLLASWLLPPVLASYTGAVGPPLLCQQAFPRAIGRSKRLRNARLPAASAHPPSPAHEWKSAAAQLIFLTVCCNA